MKVQGTAVHSYNSMISALSTALLLLSVMFVLPVPVRGEEISITDEPGDVKRTGYVEMEAEGKDEIDILELSTTETIGDVTVVLECADDISKEISYIYTISVSGIYISYQEGVFEVWRGGTEIQPIDNVQTGVAGRKLTAVLKKTAVGSELIMNATTQYYALDWTKGETTESYYDSVGDLHGEGNAVKGDYTQTYQDDPDDVKVLFLDERPSDEDGLDIISLSIDRGMDVEIRLELYDDPVIDGSASYTIYLGRSKAVWSDGSGYFHPENGGTTEIDSDLEGNIITMTLPGEHFDEGIRGVIAQSRWDIDKDTFLRDLMPDDPYSISELLPFPTGYRREINIEVRSPGNVIMERVYSDFPPQAREDIRSSIDTDDDGDVEISELDDFLISLENEILSSDHDEDLAIDGKTGEMEITINHSGLLGPVGSDPGLEIVFIQEFTFQTSDVWDYAYDVDIAYIEPGVAGSLDLGDADIKYLVTIEVRGDWEVDPLTLEPAVMSNYLSSDSSSIEYEMTGEEAKEFDPGSISFGIRVNGNIGDDDGPASEDDLTWLYILILIVMIIIIAGLLLWYRKDE